MTLYETHPRMNGHDKTVEHKAQIVVTSNGSHPPSVNGHANSNGHGPASHDLVAGLTRALLIALGEDPNRDGLRNTPDRIARMYDELLAGYHMDPATLVNGALFDVEYDEMVIVRDIEYFSLCEHHMLPFHGRAHVAYLPKDKVIGLSKIPRIVEMVARRLQVQERMTQQIAETLEDILHPRGVAVVVEGAHMCSMMRGVKKEHARMVTSAMLGAFRDDPATRNEFRQLLQLANS